jgi:hypothetical protein
MATVTVDFTARTLEVIRERGLALLKARIGQFAYNDAVATGVVPAMIEVVAWLHEQNAHYYDRRFRNSLLFLADTLESMRILTRAQGYRMRPATAASVAVLVEPEPPQPAPITIPVGTKVVLGDLTFELLVPAIIPASVPAWPDGTTDDVIALTEGLTRTDRFTSTGEKFQPFALTQPGTIDGSVSVVVLGQTWDEVPSLVFVEGTQSGRDAFTGTGLDAQEYTLSLLNALTDIEDDDGLTVLVFPLGQDQSAVQVWQHVADFTGAPREYVTFIDIDGVVRVRFGAASDGAAPAAGDSVQVLYLVSGAQKRYQLTYDEFDTGLVTFGDGVFGVIPPNGADIVVTYRVGGGVRGNIAPGVMDQTVQGLLPSGGRTAVRLRNTERGSGGEAPQSVEAARFFAPRFAKSNDRAVRKEDWVALSNTYIDTVFGAPSHANAFLKQRRPELNTVRVAVWGRDDLGRVATPGTPLKVGMKRFLDTKRTFTTVVEMIDGEVVLMDVEASLLLVQGATRTVVFAAVTEAIQTFFNSAFVRPGVDLPIGGLFQAMEEVDGVDRVTIDRIRGSRLVQITLGTGDGNNKLFTGDFPLDMGTAVVEESITVSDGTQQMVDDGEGTFTGDVDLGVPAGPGNEAIYATGKFEATFNAAPALNAIVTAEAKVEVFFAFSEDIGASDGSVQFVDTAGTFYPIVRRGPLGAWSGDASAVVDGNRVGTSSQFRGTLPTGIIDNSPVIPRPLRFIDSTGLPQIVVDNGVGVLEQPLAGSAVGTIGYSTGVFNFTFLAGPVLPVRVEWSTRTVDIYIPEEFLPLEPGRLFFWGGFSKDGAQAGGSELVAFDDGDGNIVGDVLANGFVIYETGHVVFEWNTDPPPGIAGGAARFGRLVQVPNGILTEFDLQVRTATGGGGSLVDLSSASDDGEGRTRFRLSGLSTVGFTLVDAFDNWQGGIHGPSLDSENDNFVTYSLGTGKLTFSQPLPVGTSQDFPVQVTNVTTFMYSAFVYRVKAPTGPGLDKGLFADNNGRLWGDSANPYPTNRLDHLRARLTASLAGPPIAAGRSQFLTYDALSGVPPVRDVPVAGDQIAVAGRIKLTETPPEVEGESS